MTTTTRRPPLTSRASRASLAVLAAAVLATVAAGVGVATRTSTAGPGGYTDRVGGTWTCTATGTYAGHTQLDCQGAADKFWSWTKHRGTGDVFAVDDGDGRVHFFDAADATTAAADVETIPDLAVTARG